MKLKRDYKSIFAIFWVINVCFIVISYILPGNKTLLAEYSEPIMLAMVSCTVYMELALFSRAFRVSLKYKGKKILVGRTTVLLTSALFIIDIMTIYMIGFNHPELLMANSTLLLIWIASVLIVLLTKPSLIYITNSLPLTKNGQ